ncbi:hypothetical protein [Absicoccus porci]|uniref:hypothetical protein n=1 Tax=Absicoccus porci TaxID=2486576 RepID=UPI0016063949|nr:hypothetical protein [Absicoccus porci]
MENQKKNIKPEEIWSYYLDDSKMPSPEEVANFPDTKELDRKVDEECKKIAKECGL